MEQNETALHIDNNQSHSDFDQFVSEWNIQDPVPEQCENVLFNASTNSFHV